MIRNGALLSSVVWIEAAVAVVYLLAINRALGPADYGAWSYAAACYIIVIALISCGVYKRPSMSTRAVPLSPLTTL